MDELFFIAVRGFGLGAAFAAIALSLNVIYRATHILNFAQGGMFVLGGLLGVQFSEGGYGTVSWAIGLLASVGAMGVLMAIQGAVTLWPLRHSAEQQSWLITTLSASIIISALLLLTLGPWSSEFVGRVPSIVIFDMLTPIPFLILPILALICYIGLAVSYRRSLTGLALSAISQDLDAAAAAGLRVRRLQILSFAIGGMIVGAAGYAAAPIISIAPEAGIRYVISGFVVAVVGGIGNMTGALICGPVIGIIAMIATFEFGGQFQGLITTIILTLVLLLRPGGLFGVHRARRV